MTEQDILLVIALASTAIIITLVDLLFSWWRHRRRTARAVTADGSNLEPLEVAAILTRRNAVRQRLAAIRAASDEP